MENRLKVRQWLYYVRGRWPLMFYGEEETPMAPMVETIENISRTTSCVGSLRGSCCHYPSAEMQSSLECATMASSTLSTARKIRELSRRAFGTHTTAVTKVLGRTDGKSPMRRAKSFGRSERSWKELKDHPEHGKEFMDLEE